MVINLQFFGGRGAGSATGNRGGLSFGSNAQVFDDISNLPSKIGANQRWVLAREYSVSGGGSHSAFEGKSTYEDSNHDVVARNEGFKSTSALKNAYRSRTSSVKVGDTAWTGKTDANGNKIFGKVTKNRYRPVLVTLG